MEVFARASVQLGANLQFRLKGDLRFRDYDGIRDIGNVEYCGDDTCAKFRKDFLAGLDTGLEYRFTRWLFAGIHYTLQTDSTDFFARVNGAVDPGRFVWQEVGIGVSARY